MIVEDEMVTAQSIKIILERYGYEVTAFVNTGKDALYELEKAIPDLIIMDIILSEELDGIETSKIIKSRFDIPVIYLTALTDDYTINQARATEPLGYIIKPFHERELRAAVEIALYKDKSEKETKELNKALKKSEEQYRTLVETAYEGVWVIDKNTNTVYVNLRMAQMLGYDIEEMQGRPLFDFMDDTGRLDAQEKLKAREKGKREQHDFCFLKKDGSFLWAIVNTNPLFDNHGNFVAAMAMITDITDRKRTEEELSASREQLRSLATHIEQVREEERKRISREIHDELGQALTCIKMDISDLKTEFASREIQKESILQKIREILSFVDKTIDNVRHISAELRPSMLDDLGLGAAIQWLTADFEKRSGIKCTVDIIDEPPLPGNLATALFRILQESLTNVVRHSGASHVSVAFYTEEDCLILSIHDNGRGIQSNTSHAVTSLGLLGMRERLAPFSGEMNITGCEGGGTAVVVKVPI
jgi:two-component system sensor histidine kinase UhpB